MEGPWPPNKIVFSPFIGGGAGPPTHVLFIGGGGTWPPNARVFDRGALASQQTWFYWRPWPPSKQVFLGGPWPPKKLVFYWEALAPQPTSLYWAGLGPPTNSFVLGGFALQQTRFHWGGGVAPPPNKLGVIRGPSPPNKLRAGGRDPAHGDGPAPAGGPAVAGADSDRLRRWDVFY